MILTRSLQKWGNGTGVRLPKKVVQAAKIQINQPLEVSIQGNSIVLTPVVDKKYNALDSLLKGVTPEKVSGEIDWGEDVGAEKYE